MKTKLLSSFFLAMVITLSLNAQQRPDFDLQTHFWDFEGDVIVDSIGTAGGELVGDVTIEDGILKLTGGFVELDAAAIQINTYSALSMETWFTADTVASAVNHNIMLYFGTGIEGQAWGTDYVFFTPLKQSSKLARAAITCGLQAAPWSGEDGLSITGIPSMYEVTDEANMAHAIVTLNADSITMYINGAYVGADILDDPEAEAVNGNEVQYLSNDSAFIGRSSYTADIRFQGTTDLVSLWDAELTPEEVLYLYQQGQKRPAIVRAPVGINQIKNDFNPSVYFSNNIVYISNVNSAQVQSVKIYNIIGNVVYETTGFNNEINLNLNKGIYVVSIKNNLNQTSQTKISVE